MWTRKELKEKGKKAFMLNYWRTVLVSLVFMLLVSGAVGSAAGIGGKKDTQYQALSSEETEQTGLHGVDAVKITPELNNPFNVDIPEETKLVILVVGILIALIVVGISLLISALVVNPIEVGCDRFFTRNLNQKANVSEITYGFDNNYINVVKTSFLRDIYTILWTLLLIIPGIVKTYEYRMIPYILADHPDMDTKDVFAKSKELMRGQKWKAFVLDLSFIGWEILSMLTLRIVGILYVSPYRNMTNAALYERLEYGDLAVEENI
jgi:hypothetical protein